MVSIDNDPSFWNEVANDPKVRPWIGPGEDYLDHTEILASDLVNGWRTRHGGFLVIDRGDHFEPHAYFAPQEDRAARALEDAFDFVSAFALEHPGARLEVDTPKAGKGVNALMEAVGFSREDDGDKCRWTLDLP